MAYTSNKAEGGDTSEGIFTGDPSLWVINPAQGFIMQAKENGGNLVFNNTMRRTVNNNQFFRTAAPEADMTLSRLWINMKGAADSFSQIAVGYSASGTLGIDFGWDGKALTNDGKIALYTMAENIPLAIQARPSFEYSDVVPLFYRADEAGTYTIELDHMDGLFALDQDIFLKDNLMGTTYDLKQGAYNFTTEAGTFEGRFEIIYAEALATNTLVINANDVIVFKQDNSISINSDVVEMTGVSVYDMRGRLLYRAKDINDNEAVINGITADKQILIVNISTLKGDISKKIIF